MNKVYGILLCSAIGLTASFTSNFTPFGSVTLAIVLGIIIGNLFKIKSSFTAGIHFSGHKLLPVAIALMGVNLNFLILKELGFQSILIIISTIVATIFSSIILAKLFKINTKLSLLLGIGTSICGNSAIIATEQIIGAEDKDVGIAIATINFLGTIGIFLIPALGSLILKYNDIHSGVLIGNTLQAVGQVVAAGFTLSDMAGQTATIIKMARVLMLTPMILILILVYFKKPSSEKINKKKNTPYFVIGFILFSFIPTFSILPQYYIDLIGKLSHNLILVAMAGIGLKITLGNIITEGKSALLVGSLLFLIQIGVSICLLFLLLN